MAPSLGAMKSSGNIPIYRISYHPDITHPTIDTRKNYEIDNTSEIGLRTCGETTKVLKANIA